MFARIMGKAVGKTTNKRGGGEGRSSNGIQKRYIKRLRAEPSGLPKVAFISRASALIGAQRSRVKWTLQNDRSASLAGAGKLLKRPVDYRDR